MNRIVVWICLGLLFTAGCASPTSTATPTPKPAPDLLVQTETAQTVDITITHGDSGEELLNRTYELNGSEEVQFDTVLSEPIQYDVVVNVRGGDSWSRTLVPSQGYLIDITRSGEIRVAL